MIEAPYIDLSTIPVAQRAVVVALMETIAALQEITRRQQHLIAEMNHALHGKRSEKLAEDERQLEKKEKADYHLREQMIRTAKKLYKQADVLMKNAIVGQFPRDKMY